jgi:uncharacterized protein RhaS with RHS repeats
MGNYLSQDPIGLDGGNPTLYGYVKDVNSWVDVFGLYLRRPYIRKSTRVAVEGIAEGEYHLGTKMAMNFGERKPKQKQKD